MKRVLYIGGFELPDGNAAAQRVLAVGKSLKMAGCEVEFVGVTHDERKVGVTLEIDGMAYTSIAYPKGLSQWLEMITRFIPLEVIGQKQPDIVILYNFYAVAQQRILKYCRSRGIAVWADLTEWPVTEGLSLRNVVKRLDVKLRMEKYNMQLDGIIAISRYLYDYYKDRVRTVYVPVTVDYEQEKWNRDRMVQAHRPVRLVYAGSPGTGAKDRLDKIVDSVSGRSGFELSVIGITEGQYKAAFGDKVGENVTFAGRIPYTEVLRRLQDSDFEVIIRDDNLVTRAGFPTKFVESLACGVPVIATPSSNILDYLKDGENGFVVSEEQSLDDCLNRVERMSGDELVRMKRAAKDTVSFDIKKYVSDLNIMI